MRWLTLVVVEGEECSVPFESRYPHEAMGESDAMRSSVSLGEVGARDRRRLGDPRQVRSS